MIHTGKKEQSSCGKSSTSSGGFCHRGGKRGTGKLTSFLCCFVNNQAGEGVGGCESQGAVGLRGCESRELWGSGAVSLRGPWDSGSCRALKLWDSGGCGTRGLWGPGAAGPLLRLVQEERGNGLQQVTAELHKSTDSFTAGTSETGNRLP